MLRQATQGDVDVITGDYLAGLHALSQNEQNLSVDLDSLLTRDWKEMNLAEHAEAMASGQHKGYDPYAFDGIQQTINVLWQKRIKVILNAGALNPKGLSREIQELVRFEIIFGRGFEVLLMH
jgi:hypothetical protein